MKVMSKAKIFEFGIEDQMASEIEIMGLLDHPNVIRLEFYFETRDELILILEYACNGTLFRLVKDRAKCLAGRKSGKPLLDDKQIIKVPLTEVLPGDRGRRGAPARAGGAHFPPGHQAREYSDRGEPGQAGRLRVLEPDGRGPGHLLRDSRLHCPRDAARRGPGRKGSSLFFDKDCEPDGNC